MNRDEGWFPGHPTEIDPAECAELLASRSAGRVARSEHGPVVLPVNYVIGRGDVNSGSHSTRASPRTCGRVPRRSRWTRSMTTPGPAVECSRAAYRDIRRKMETFP